MKITVQYEKQGGKRFLLSNREEGGTPLQAFVMSFEEALLQSENSQSKDSQGRDSYEKVLDAQSCHACCMSPGVGEYARVPGHGLSRPTLHAVRGRIYCPFI